MTAGGIRRRSLRCRDGLMRIVVTPEDGHRHDVAIRGHAIIKDQRVSGGGYHEGPTPTELFVASLAACVAFYVGGFLRRHSLAEGGFGVDRISV
jgi:uncharacterized OsmC-like protein